MGIDNALEVHMALLHQLFQYGNNSALTRQSLTHKTSLIQESDKVQ